MIRIGVLEPTDFSLQALETLRGVGEVACFEGGDREGFLKDKEVVFVRLGHRVNTEFLREAMKLQVLVSPTTGITHMDIDALEWRHITVLTLQGETDFLRSITASSEHCLGMILGLLRNYPRAILSPGNIHWDRDSVRGHDVRGLSIGLIGFGRIGQWLSRVLLIMGAQVRWCDSSMSANYVASEAMHCESIAQLIDESTVVVLSASYVPGAPPLLDATLIDSLKGKYLVNIARGELLDEPHLLRRLREGWFSGVALDVLASEPKPLHELAEIAQLAATQNFMLTPHIGGATYESSHRTEEFMAGKLIQHLLSSGTHA